MSNEEIPCKKCGKKFFRELLTLDGYKYKFSSSVSSVSSVTSLSNVSNDVSLKLTNETNETNETKCLKDAHKSNQRNILTVNRGGSK